MKDKLKTRFDEIRRDPFAQGMIIGSVLGTTACVVVLKTLHANFSDPATTLHIPDHIVDSILATGMPVLLNRQDGVQLTIGPS